MIQTPLTDVGIDSTEASISIKQVPQGVSRIGLLLVVAAEIILVIALAFFLVRLLYLWITPDADYIVNPAMPSLALDASEQSDYQAIVSFDPFYRQVGPSNVSNQAAPETKLKITVAGLRVGADGSGAAIIEAQGAGQKLVLVGNEISPGVTLSKLFPDRIEITRRGLRETVYMTKPDTVPLLTADDTPEVVDQPTARASTRAGLVAIFANLSLEPVRRSGRLAGFRVLGDSDADSLALANLEVEDIILSVNGAALTSFERLNELGDELADADSITIEIERRGERLSLSL